MNSLGNTLIFLRPIETQEYCKLSIAFDLAFLYPLVDGREDAMLLKGEIGSSATFLLGARTRFGRVIRFNNRLLY